MAQRNRKDSLLRGTQLDDGHLRRRTNPNGRPPEAGPVRHIDRNAVNHAETAHHGLLQRHEQVEGSHLPAVRMPGNLQVNAVRGGVVSNHRLMRHKHNGPSRVPITESPTQIGPIPEVGAAKIVDPGQVKPAKLKPLVAQRPNAKPSNLGNPLLIAGVVLVIARDEVGTPPRLDIGKRGGEPPKLGDTAVDEIPDDADDVGVNGVDELNDAAGMAWAGKRAEVNVGDNGQAGAIHGPRKLGKRKLHPIKLRRPKGGLDAVAGNAGGSKPGKDRGAPSKQQPPTNPTCSSAPVAVIAVLPVTTPADGLAGAVIQVGALCGVLPRLRRSRSAVQCAEGLAFHAFRPSRGRVA